MTVGTDIEFSVGHPWAPAQEELFWVDGILDGVNNALRKR